jgi:hypothetical protein
LYVRNGIHNIREYYSRCYQNCALPGVVRIRGALDDSDVIPPQAMGKNAQ